MTNKYTKTFERLDISPILERKNLNNNKCINKLNNTKLTQLSRTLPTKKIDESLSQLLQKQAKLLEKSKSQPNISDEINQALINSNKRARDKLIVEIELYLQRQQILIDTERLQYSTNKRYLEIFEFNKILKNYKIYDLLYCKLQHIQSVLKQQNGTIDFLMFIDCIKKAQAVPTFILPKPRQMTPIQTPVSWSLPPLPPIKSLNKNELESNHWTDNKWREYYLDEKEENYDENVETQKSNQTVFDE